MKAFWLVALCLFAVPALAQEDLAGLTPEARMQRQLGDLAAVMRYREGLHGALEYVRAHPDIFSEQRSKDPALLSAQDREAVRQFWQRVLDYYLALDSLGRYHAAFADFPDRGDRERSFSVSNVAFLAEYRTALELIAAAQRNASALDLLLNESMPALGLPAGTYDRFKFRYLNVARATEFAALEAVRGTMVKGDSAASRAMKDDAKAIWRMGRGPGHAMTFKNGVDIVRKAGFTAWFPVQAGVAEWMGDVKVYRVERSLISSEQIAALPDRLEPGDVLLERREWFLSNVGLPGFWPHAAIYVGTPQDRAHYFDDPDVQRWVRAEGEASGDFERLLRVRHPRSYATGVAALEHDHMPRVIEAISEGVSFTSIEHSADADSVAVLRPRLSKVEKAAALLRAFGYVGRPYDFNFDFRTDAELVCTELVYKAYEPLGALHGLKLPLVEMLGRLATPANEIARQFDSQYGTDAQQFDLVLFLDGYERERLARAASLEEFRLSWRRPKWHVLVQDLASSETSTPSTKTPQ